MVCSLADRWDKGEERVSDHARLLLGDPVTGSLDVDRLNVGCDVRR
jgi:hypothetical protein